MVPQVFRLVIRPLPEARVDGWWCCPSQKQWLPHLGAEVFLTSSLHPALEDLTYGLDTLGLVIGRLLFTVVNRGTIYEFSAENRIKCFPLCTCL